MIQCARQCARRSNNGKQSYLTIPEICIFIREMHRLKSYNSTTPKNNSKDDPKRLSRRNINCVQSF